MNNSLAKLTLVVPTYNRHSYALRNMFYWSGRSVTVHVLDGSPTPISLPELSGLAQNIHYHHLPVSIFDRLRIATELISTDYCALMGDDEFFIPSALESCIAELDLYSDLVSCTLIRVN